jgi:hypothetical protein
MPLENKYGDGHPASFLHCGLQILSRKVTHWLLSTPVTIQFSSFTDTGTALVMVSKTGE